MGAAGFRAGLRVVTEWVTRQRRSEKADAHLARRAPPARLLSRLLIAQRVQLPEDDAVMVAAIETGVPMLAVARDLVERFHCMLRARDIGTLPGWLAETGTSMLVPVWEGNRCRPVRGDDGADRAMVERANRRADHQAQAGQATDVRPRPP